MKRTKKILLIAIPIVVIITAIFLIIYLLNDCNGMKETVRIESNGKVVENFTVSNLDLYPGSEDVTEVFFSSKVSGKFDLSLEFSEIADGGLKNFVVVEVLFDGELMDTKSLLSLIDGEKISFDCKISTSKKSSLKIVYKMPIETDDTAQDTTASFNVGLKIDKK